MNASNYSIEAKKEVQINSAKHTRQPIAFNKTFDNYNSIS